MKKEREFNEVPDYKEVTLRLCRLTYMLINELVENEEQRKEHLGLVDKVVERVNGEGVRSLSGDESR
jgi:hypothetical protein